MIKAKVDVYSHNFKVTGFDYDVYRAMTDFCIPLIQTGLERRPGGRFKTTNLKVFAAATSDRSEFRFHINLFPKFIGALRERGIREESLEVNKHALKTPAKLKGKTFPHLVLRDYQEPIVQFLVERGCPIRVLSVQTGRGKTMMALKGAERLGYRTVVIVPAMFADKWHSDILETFDVDKNEILYVKGLKSLYGLFKMAAAGALTEDFILISSTTMQMFMRNYECDTAITLEKGPHPEEFFEILEAGFKIIDEVHKGIHLNIKMDLYTHIEKSAYLSATIDASQPFINRMNQMAYPNKDRYQGLAFDRYVAMIALEYNLLNPEKARFKDKQGNYSHIVYEQYLMKHPQLLKEYDRMNMELVEDLFIKTREPDHTMIVFAASVDYCTHLTKQLRARYPDMSIGRYVGEDDYTVFVESTIVVSTVLSSGTALDKENLTVVLMTNSIDSKQSNEQSIGRLRRVKKYPDLTPRFYYLYCRNIPKQVEYHERKMENYKEKAKTQLTMISGYRIG